MLHSPQILLPPRQGLVAGVVSTATFDAANNFQLTLSPDKLTATNSVGAASFGNARGTTSHSTGKFFISWTIIFSVLDQCGIGLCDTTQSFASGFFIGAAAHAMGTVTSGGGAGHINFNGSELGPYAAGAPSSGDVEGLAINLDSRLVWGIRNAGGWNNDTLTNQNPDAGIGGYPIGLVGALFPCCDVESNTISGTLNPGASPPASASTFGPWT